MKKVNKPVKAYKGFNKHMQCTLNGKIFQYEIGKEYKEDKADLCHCGFHACENPLDVLSYYNNIDDKFCEVELDKIDPNRNKDSKICGKKIKIGIEIGFLGLFKAGIEWIKNKTIFTNTIFRPFLISGEISSISFSFFFGTQMVLIPAFLAASVFSFSPPIGSTRPRSVISPVIATSARTGVFVIADNMAVAIVIPADGPSFGTAPSGMWIWMSFSWKNFFGI